MIAQLDRALAKTGETVIVRRYTAPTGNPRPKSEITVRARRRDVKDDDMVGDIRQVSSVVILSPTGLAALLPLVPGDKIVLGNRERNVELPRPRIEQDTLVRMDVLVSG